MVILNYLFWGPWTLTTMDAIDCPSVYLILARTLRGRPVPYVGQKGSILWDGTRYPVIYAGENGPSEIALTSSSMVAEWKRWSIGELSVTFMSTPSETYSTNERLVIVREIVEVYRPPCNN